MCNIPNVFYNLKYRKCKTSRSIILDRFIPEKVPISKKVKGNMFGFSTNEINKVKVGIIGLGNRGNVLLQMFQYLVEKYLNMM